MTGNGRGNGRSPLRFVPSPADERPVLITGGAGFVGANLADRLLSEGRDVIVFDNLSRPGVERNLQWLADTHPHGLRVELGDVRNARAVERAVRAAAQVYHFAAQVAVTTSIEDPILDFDVNARGTLNVLEAARRRADPPTIVFTSTNKVYGSLRDVGLRRTSARYEPESAELRAHGIAEDRSLAFHSPYGCSKGAADQYVLDYARTMGVPAVVFRMSCIYGPHQFGTEDQGWIAHFLIRAMEHRPITLFGDGRQVRDVLFVDDLVAALMLAQARIDDLTGRAFNIGGGPGNATSLIEVIDAIGSLRGERPAVTHAPWRPGDQRYYVSDTRAFGRATGWRPSVSVADGLERLHDWLTAHRTPSGPVRFTLATERL